MMDEVLHIRRIGLKNDMTHLKIVLSHCVLADAGYPPDGLYRVGTPVPEALEKREKLLQGLRRKPMKNASLAVEFFVSAGEDFNGWQGFFKDAEAFLLDRYGKDNCISRAIHTGGDTPHLHLVFVPIVGEGDSRKYSSGEFIGTRLSLVSLHRDFREAVSKRHGLGGGKLK